MAQTGVRNRYFKLLEQKDLPVLPWYPKFTEVPDHLATPVQLQES